MLIILKINPHCPQRTTVTEGGSSRPVTTIAKQGNLTAAKPAAGCTCWPGNGASQNRLVMQQRVKLLSATDRQTDRQLGVPHHDSSITALQGCYTLRSSLEGDNLIRNTSHEIRNEFWMVVSKGMWVKTGDIQICTHSIILKCANTCEGDWPFE